MVFLLVSSPFSYQQVRTLPTTLNLKRWTIRVDAYVGTSLLLFYTFWMGAQWPLTSHGTLGDMTVCSRNLITLWGLNYQAMNAYYWPTRVEIQENTIPHDLAVTTARPDMIYICNNTVVLIELMILSMHQRVYKMLNQINKANNSISKSWVTWTHHGSRPWTLVTIEIGSLGHSLPSH